MKTLFSVAAICMLLLPLCVISQVKVDKENIPFNNYDNKYYYQGKPFSGIMKSGNNEIAFQNGEVNGAVTSHDNSGKVYRKLTYSNGHFNGEFITERYKGTFQQDTVIGKLTVYGYSGRNKDYEYDFRYLNNQVGVSYQFDAQGSVAKEGIIYSNVGDYFYTASGLIIDIESFLEGENFLRISSFPNLIKFTPENMHHLTYYYKSTGKVEFKQLFAGDSLVGEVNFHQNGFLKDSARFIYPLHVVSSFAAGTLEKDMKFLYKNRYQVSYAENGKLQEKYTLKYFPAPKDNDEYVMESSLVKNIHDFETYFSTGKPEHKWHFNESGKLDGPYLSYYISGIPRIKAQMLNGTCSMPFFFYSESGKLRFSITKNQSGEWVFEDFLPDGFLKIKKTLSAEELKICSPRLIEMLRMGRRNNELEMFGNDDDLIERLFSPEESEDQ
ncbi:MAG: hypothetical protein FGM61_02790 [Sediminibacterium sp.]|nr:hypothetical protein [Sediminibacterium sp.]